MDIKEWIKRCRDMRGRIVRRDGGNEYLLANFTGTAQQKDIEARTPVVQDFFRVKINVKAFDENEMQKKGKPAVDFSDTRQVMRALAEEFDMPFWAYSKMPGSGLVREDGVSLQDYNRVFVYQLKACNLYCPWCYVDDENKNGLQGNGRFFSVPEITDIFNREREKQPLHMLRLSGGEPTLAIEQWLEILRELKRRKMENEVYVQGETNLTTGSFIEHLKTTGQIERDLLEKVGEFRNFGVLCSFKGTDAESFRQATGTTGEYAFLEEERWKTFGMLVKAGIDAYPFIYDANPETLEQFIDNGIARFGEGFGLKTWVVGLKLYGPEKQRLEKLGLDSATYQQRLDKRFERSKEIMRRIVRERFCLDYQSTPRTAVKLRK